LAVTTPKPREFRERSFGERVKVVRAVDRGRPLTPDLAAVAASYARYVIEETGSGEHRPAALLFAQPTAYWVAAVFVILGATVLYANPIYWAVVAIFLVAALPLSRWNLRRRRRRAELALAANEKIARSAPAQHEEGEKE
jgi:Flp pilus assembly protein TadB